MKKTLLFILSLFYILVWHNFQKEENWLKHYISSAFPSPVIKAASSYARQLAGFSLFVKVAVFEGSNPDSHSLVYGPGIAQNFEVMSEVYPEFIDISFYAQSFLAPLEGEYTERANLIHDRILKLHPDYPALYLFKGFNAFYYLKDYKLAGEIFLEASKLENAPRWFAHFAGMLMARGGNLIAGRGLIATMEAVEENEKEKARYRRSLENLDKAIEIQKALDSYLRDRGHEAEDLMELIPDYIEGLPELHDDFMLLWEPPLLRLERPHTPFKKAES